MFKTIRAIHNTVRRQRLPQKGSTDFPNAQSHRIGV